MLKGSPINDLGVEEKKEERTCFLGDTFLKFLECVF